MITGFLEELLRRLETCHVLRLVGQVVHGGQDPVVGLEDGREGLYIYIYI